MAPASEVITLGSGNTGRRFNFQLLGDEFDVSPIPFEVDILARERLETFQVWVVVEVALGPKVDRLTAYQEVGSSFQVAEIEDA